MSPALRYYIDLRVWESMKAVYEAFGKDVPAPSPLDYVCDKCGKFECEHHPEYF